MDNRDGLKEELGWLKVILVVAATLEFSLVGWIVNTSDAPVLLYAGASGLAMGVALSVIRTLQRADAILTVLKRSPNHDTP